MFTEEGGKNTEKEEKTELQKLTSEQACEKAAEENQETAKEAIEAKDEKITMLKSEYETLLKERDTYLDLARRAKADFINYQKMVTKQTDEAIQLAISNIMLQLLPVLDKFELIIEKAKETTAEELLKSAVEMVYNELKKITQLNGLTPMEDIIGKEFDPFYHEAVETVKNDELKENTIVEVIRKGYLFKGRLLRAAQVKVSSHKDSQQTELQSTKNDKE